MPEGFKSKKKKKSRNENLLSIFAKHVVMNRCSCLKYDFGSDHCAPGVHGSSEKDPMCIFISPMAKVSTGPRNPKFQVELYILPCAVGDIYDGSGGRVVKSREKKRKKEWIQRLR